MYDDLTLEDLAKARKMIGPSTNENEQNKLKEYFSKEENAVLTHSFSFEDEEMNASRENLRSFFSCQGCIIFMCVLGADISSHNFHHQKGELTEICNPTDSKTSKYTNMLY